MELCKKLQLAHSQLNIQSWELVNALQVLSELTRISIFGLMVAWAFLAKATGLGSRQFELVLGLGSEIRCPVAF